MWTQVLNIVLTSALSSALTLALAWLVFDRYLKERLLQELEVAADDLGSRIRQQVSEGVREGIGNGLTDLREKAARSAAKGGLDILEENLGLFFKGDRQKD